MIYTFLQGIRKGNITMKKTSIFIFVMSTIACIGQAMSSSVTVTEAIDWNVVRRQITTKKDKDNFSLVCKRFQNIDADQTVFLIPKCTSLKVQRDNYWDQQDPDIVNSLLDTKSIFGCSICETGQQPIGFTELYRLAIRFPKIEMMDLSGRITLAPYDYLPRIVPFDKMYSITIEGVQCFKNISTLILGKYPNISIEQVNRLTTLAQLDVSQNDKLDYSKFNGILSNINPNFKIFTDKNTFDLHITPVIDNKYHGHFILNQLIFEKQE
jgi:hypothetical protein